MVERRCQCKCKSRNPQLVDCEVISGSQLNPTMITWVYADAGLQRRKQNWNKLRYIARGRRAHGCAWKISTK